MADNPRNVAPNLRELRAAIDTERDRQAAAPRQLANADASPDERLAAILAIGPASGTAVSDDLLKLVGNAAEPVELRVAALERLETSVLENGAFIDDVIRLVRDRATPVPLRIAGLRLLQVGDIASAVFRSRLAAYINLLRDLLDEPNEALRRTATQKLALKGDAVVQDRLVDELKGARPRSVEPEEAIQFLSYNLHANHLPVLREVVRNPPNLVSKKEALRNLAADAEAADLLAAVVEDHDEDPEVRHVAAVSLSASQPGRAREAAERIVLDKGETGNLRTAMLNTIVHSKGRHPNDTAFAEALARIPKRGLPPGFRAVYDRFLSSRERGEK